MIDLRPIFFVVGRVLVAVALLMLFPAWLDAQTGAMQNASAFLQSAVIAGVVGLLVSFATSNALVLGLNLRQAYLLTVSIWAITPIFARPPHTPTPLHV
jgi:trk system potassium uptake protein